MELTVQRGTTGYAVRFLLIGDDDRAISKTGLAAHTAGLRVAYLRDGDSGPTAVSVSPWKADSLVPGAFREIDAALMPGLYELVLPDEILAEGAHRATLMIQGPEVCPFVVHIDLVGYDPYDGDRLGLDCLSREARHDVISRAFREVVPEIVDEFRHQALPAIE